MNFLKKIIFSTKSDLEKNNRLIEEEINTLKMLLENANNRIVEFEKTQEKILEKIETIENKVEDYFLLLEKKIDDDNEKVEKIADAVNIYLFKDLLEKYNLELNKIIQQKV
jgi:predicted  nucleic acid-binding Zn-ribbon protein